MKKTFYPSKNSVYRPLSYIGSLLFILSVVFFSCAYFTFGINLETIKLLIFFPSLFFIFLIIIFLSYKIRITEKELIFFMFFMPVKVIKRKAIICAKYEKISQQGQPCVITISFENTSYSYPVRLFDCRQIDSIILLLNQTQDIGSRLTTPNESVYSLNRYTVKYYVKYILTIIVIILFALLWKKII